MTGTVQVTDCDRDAASGHLIGRRPGLLPSGGGGNRRGPNPQSTTQGVRRGRGWISVVSGTRCPSPSRESTVLARPTATGWVGRTLATVYLIEPGYCGRRPLINAALAGSRCRLLSSGCGRSRSHQEGNRGCCGRPANYTQRGLWPLPGPGDRLEAVSFGRCLDSCDSRNPERPPRLPDATAAREPGPRPPLASSSATAGAASFASRWRPSSSAARKEVGPPPRPTPALSTSSRSPMATERLGWQDVIGLLVAGTTARERGRYVWGGPAEATSGRCRRR